MDTVNASDVSSPSPSRRSASPSQKTGRNKYPLQPAFRNSLLYHITTASHVSAGVFGSFLCVHLAPPLVVGVGKVLSTLSLKGGGVDEAVDTASRLMLLGRVYYQFAVTEPILYAALGVHVLSAASKRLLSLLTVSSSTRDMATPSAPTAYAASSPPPIRSSIHTLTGHLLIPLVGHHILLNRLLPSLSTSPISALSPSELDYSFVSYGLHVSPFLTTTLYTALIAAIGIHTTTGTIRVIARWRKRAPSRIGSKTKSLAATIMTLLLAGLAALAPQLNDDGKSWSLVGAMERRVTECYRRAGFGTTSLRA